MQVDLLRSVKLRVMDELRYAVQQHQVYRDKVEIFHKFPFAERKMMGVVLRGASATRQKLSADDHAGTLKSYVALARAENREDGFLDWVWEDREHTTALQVKEDLASQITGDSSIGTNRIFYVLHKPIVSGPANLVSADNFRQIEVLQNGAIVHAEFVDGNRGMFVLPMAPVVGDTLTVSYNYSIITPPGRYYIEMISTTQFVIDPLYVVKREQVIERTTGLEISANLQHGDVYGDFDQLYLKKYHNSNDFYLEKGVDYTLNTAGLITFLNPLPVGTSLYANYRWAGSRLGPFDVPKEFHYVNTALPGVTLAFSNQLDAGSRMVVIVYPQREPAADVYSSHYNMTFEIDVFTRDPQSLADLTDHVINELWNNRRLKLIDEGLTIWELDPGGESEDVYDTNTNDLYYKNSVSMQMMTEWKKFVPYLTDIQDVDTQLYLYTRQNQYIVTNQNQLFELRLVPCAKPFEVKYPTEGYPRYF